MNSLTNNETGTTFLELMVALSLGLILIGGAALSVSKLLTLGTEKQTAEDITSFLEQASLNAIRAQQSVKVTMKLNQLIESSNLRSLSLSNSYSYTTRFGGNENSIVYYPSGFASAGTISVHGEYNLCIISQTISGARRTRCSNVN